ncbi:MAG: thioredoxin [Lachnospiraceae bacterium]|nr:thioredoxin [Lachnospiraceae bacterium]
MILITVFTLMIIAGIYNDEASVVLKKAANICLECIGLGG